LDIYKITQEKWWYKFLYLGSRTFYV